MEPLRTEMPLNPKFQHRVIVTAGASGIGLAVAQQFLSQGAQVWVCDVNKNALDHALIANDGLQGQIADVGNPQEVERFFTHALESMSGLDILVNNAGVGGPVDSVEDIDYQAWDDCIRTNLSGMFYCSKQVIPIMKQQESGCIINISTTSAKTGLPYRLAYVTSKVGVLGFTHNMARELGKYGIRCNTVLPGLMDNPRGRLLVDKLAKTRGISCEEAEAEYLKYISMHSWIKPSDVANTVCFLASSQAAHITAQEIAVDGNIEWEQ